MRTASLKQRASVVTETRLSARSLCLPLCLACFRAPCRLCRLWRAVRRRRPGSSLTPIWFLVCALPPAVIPSVLQWTGGSWGESEQRAGMKQEAGGERTEPEAPMRELLRLLLWRARPRAAGNRAHAYGLSSFGHGARTSRAWLYFDTSGTSCFYRRGWRCSFCKSAAGAPG
jgi:hypothetical protein